MLKIQAARTWSEKEFAVNPFKANSQHTYFFFSPVVPLIRMLLLVIGMS